MSLFDVRRKTTSLRWAVSLLSFDPVDEDSDMLGRHCPYEDNATEIGLECMAVLVPLPVAECCQHWIDVNQRGSPHESVAVAETCAP